MALFRSIGKGHSLQQQKERFECIRCLYEFSVTGGRGFVVPSSIAEYCIHDWIVLDSGYACCKVCGYGHVCSSVGSCLKVRCQDSSVVCAITGVVIVESEFREERNVDERISYITQNGTTSVFDGSDMDDESVGQKNIMSGCRRKRKGAFAVAESNVENGTKKKENKYSVRSVKKRRFCYNGEFHRMDTTREVCTNQRFLVVTAFDNDIGKFCEAVETNVTDILASDKTRLCFEQEIKRNECKLTSLLSKLLRECAHNKECIRPNILSVFTQLYFHANKCRLSYNSNHFVHQNDIEGEGWNSVDIIRQNIQFWSVGNTDNASENVLSQLIKVCSQSISNLLLLHGGPRVLRHLQSTVRCREFVCSMLYLMRMGITYENRQLLPKIDILHQYLPMQVLLPVVFKIRAKSITEGENIIKLDIRKMPLI